MFVLIQHHENTKGFIQVTSLSTSHFTVKTDLMDEFQTVHAGVIRAIILLMSPPPKHDSAVNAARLVIPRTSEQRTHQNFSFFHLKGAPIKLRHEE